MVSFGIPEVDWKSLILPLAYILVLGGSLYTFSNVYRKRKAGMFSFLFSSLASPAKPSPTHGLEPR
jgi:hypothetical protein